MRAVSHSDTRHGGGFGDVCSARAKEALAQVSEWDTADASFLPIGPGATLVASPSCRCQSFRTHSPVIVLIHRMMNLFLWNRRIRRQGSESESLPSTEA